MLHAVAESWQQLAAIRNVEFSINLASAAFVMGDASVLRRLADILLDNAFKYTPSPGAVHLLLAKEGENAVIAVRDTGVGIPEEELQKIFERFYRVDKARSRDHGGAGLGLAIAQWIVDRHGGSIRVESCNGAGANFRVEIPLVPVPVHNPLPA
jgi:signal transduction histidine kinase